MHWRHDTSFIYLRFAMEQGLSYEQVLRAADVLQRDDADVHDALISVTPYWHTNLRNDLIEVYNIEQMRRRDVQTAERIAKRRSYIGHGMAVGAELFRQSVPVLDAHPKAQESRPMSLARGFDDWYFGKRKQA